MLFWHLPALKHLGLSLWQQRRAWAQLASQRLVPPALEKAQASVRHLCSFSAGGSHTIETGLCRSPPWLPSASPVPVATLYTADPKFPRSWDRMHVWQVLPRETQKV